MHTRVPQPLPTLLTAVALALPATALAQPRDWSVTGAGSGAAPTNGPYDAEYGLGVMGGAGAYRSVLPALGVGLRLDAGGIANEEEFDGSLGDGMLTFGALTPAVRYRPLHHLGVQRQDGNRGLYVELAGGASLLETQVEPVVAPAVGYILDAGRFGIGPTARYLQVITGDGDTPGGEDVRIMTLGVELVFLDQEPAPRRPAEEVAQAPLQREPAASVPSEEVQRVAGRDDESDALTAGQGRMLLEERLFFDTDSASLRQDGRRELDRIADMYQTRQPRERWTALRVSGHADQRGPASYNLELSRMRAEAVREYLVSRGVPEDLIDVRAYGEERPIVPDPNSPSDLQKNRRVQFEIVREPSVERE